MVCAHWVLVEEAKINQQETFHQIWSDYSVMVYVTKLSVKSRVKCSVCWEIIQAVKGNRFPAPVTLSVHTLFTFMPHSSAGQQCHNYTYAIFTIALPSQSLFQWEITSFAYYSNSVCKQSGQYLIKMVSPLDPGKTYIIAASWS